MDKAAYYLAVSHSTSMIRRYFEGRSTDPEEIADLTQEAIASLLESSGRYREACSFTTWAYSVCRNVYRRQVYYAVRRRKLGRSLQHEFSEQVKARQGNQETIDSEMRMAALEASIERLDAHDRRLYRLYYAERLSVASVSHLLDRSEGTVKWQLHRLRRRIRDAILNLKVDL